jgi:hypothetical protein
MRSEISRTIHNWRRPPRDIERGAGKFDRKDAAVQRGARQFGHAVRRIFVARDRVRRRAEQFSDPLAHQHAGTGGELLLRGGVCNVDQAAVTDDQHAVGGVVENCRQNGVVLAFRLRVRGFQFVFHQPCGAVVQPAFSVEFVIGLIDNRQQGIDVDAFAVLSGGGAQLPCQQFMHAHAR